MRSHDYADIFPMMGDVEFEALKADILANGQKNPIIVYRETILDGRNRWKACNELHIKPITQPYFGADALGFVLSQNLHRRHLNEAERAMIAAELVIRGKSETPPVGGVLKIPKASKLMNVGTRSVERAVKITASGDEELIAQVKAKEVSLTQAEAMVTKQPKADQSFYDIAIKALEKCTEDEIKQASVWIADRLG